MKWYIFLLVFTLLSLRSFGINYPVSAIPDALKKEANMIVRYSESKITIKSNAKAVYTRHYVYTIMSEAAEEYSVFYDYYDKFKDINNISGTLYDANGNKIKNVRKKDILDESGNFGMHLAIDARLKIHSFYFKRYPYTVEYEVESELNGYFSLPDWQPIPEAKIAVESSKLIVVTPENYQLRFKQFHYNGNPRIAKDNSNKEYIWEIKNVEANNDEQSAPDWDELTTRVLIAPTNFEIGGYAGQMDSWQNFGSFISLLYNGRDALPNDVKLKVHELTDHLTNDKDKTVVLYKFLQNNTHYISIQLGLGGWQPLDATYVATKKYGDCKALSNYMVALLKEAGITGNIALIRAGDDESSIISDFSSNQFNHAIVCVPQGKDSIWLECTSQTVSPGYMGSFTGNRMALIINGKKSTLVKTPVYDKNKNLQIRKVNAKVDEGGSLTAKVFTIYTGQQQDGLHKRINEYSQQEQDNQIKQALPNFDVQNFSYKEYIWLGVPAIEESVQLGSANYANISGKRMFITPNFLPLYTKKIEELENRKYEIYYDFAFIDRDTFIIEIPAGYEIEAMPKPVLLNNQFGSYHIYYSYKNATLQMVRTYERNAGRFPASDYKEYADFYNTIYKADRYRVVLIKKD